MDFVREEISKNKLFAETNFDDFQTIIEQCKINQYAEGDVVLSPKKDNEFIYLVLSGKLSIHLESPESCCLRTVAKGSCVGDLSLIRKSKPSAYVIAQEATTLLEIHRDEMREIINIDCQVERNLLLIISNRMISNTNLMIENRKQVHEFETIAMVDGLTGIYNRRWLDSAMERHIERSRCSGEPLSFFIIDVDHFKKFNDDYGHQAGDYALIVLAKVLAETIRTTDYVARYGGEEFAVLLPSTNLTEACKIAKRINQVVENNVVQMPDGTRLPSITVSIGISQTNRDSSPEEILATADKHLYRAKAQGRNGYCC